MDRKFRSKRFLFITVAVVLATALVIPGVAGAAEASATRTLPASVASGADFDVGIEASGCGAFGQVVETLPSGFSYVSTDSTDVIVTEEDSTVNFTFMGDSVSFDYTVTASTTAGTYSFSGVVKDEDKVEYTTTGDINITVGPTEGVSATRTLPASVASGADFDVGIEASGCGAFGQVVETLPSGFSYVSTDSTDVIVTEEDSTVNFTFMGDSVSFDYTVTASTTAGTYSFSGVVKDEDKVEYTTTGDTDITVGVPVVSATRTLPDCIELGADFDVGIEASGCGAFGQVVETLPSGFSYVSTDSTDVIVTEEDSTVNFTFMGDSVSFDYTVTASTTAGTYSFSGVVKDEDKVEYTTTGDINITVAVDCMPLPVELEFRGSLAKGERETLVNIPGGATELEITLDATADIDLELYDSTTFVIGWNAIISSSGSTTRTYQGDTFAYSGWAGGDEYITADGPLSRAYTLKVYGYEAGDYVVTVSYMPGPPDETPPQITITAPDATVGIPTTIEVSATDLSGVHMIWFSVYPAEDPEEWPNGEYPLAMICTFTDEGSLTFTPGWAGTYTVEAGACDELGNCTPETTLVEMTFVVSE